MFELTNIICKFDFYQVTILFSAYILSRCFLHDIFLPTCSSLRDDNGGEVGIGFLPTDSSLRDGNEGVGGIGFLPTDSSLRDDNGAWTELFFYRPNHFYEMQVGFIS